MADGAVLTNVFDSYTAVGIREELSDLISMISPTDVPFTSNIGSESCVNTYFEWQTDSLPTAAQSHAIDGFDIATYSATTATSRIGNYTSIANIDFAISGTTEATNRAGRGSELAYQVTRNAKALRRHIEVNYTANNAAVAGDSTTERETGGLPVFLKANVSSSNTNSVDPVWTSAPTGARSDGVERASSEALLKTVIRKVYDSGGDPSMIMVGSVQKQNFSAFAGIAAQRFMAPGAPTTIVGAADLYVSDFGTLSIVPNRFQPPQYAFVLEPGGIRERVLRDFQIHEMAKTGDAEKRLLLKESGLQVDNQAAHGILADIASA